VEAKKVTHVAWREDDFEERHFDPRMFASGGANTWVIEKKARFHFWSQGIVDIVCVRPHGNFGIVEAKVEPQIEPKSVLIWLHSNARWADREDLIKIQRHVYASLIHTGVVLSRPSIDEPSHQEERSASAFSAYASLWEDDELQNGAAVHPLTKSVYQELAKIPGGQREAIQFVLNQLAMSMPKDKSTTLPPLRLAPLEDSSYLLEWTFEDRRLGFSFEANPKDSGWYYVYSNDSSERYESGTMDQLEVSRLIAMTLKS
jgi:hypothetical protein